ncbi:SLC13A5.2 family protein [Megaselia abdita]
MHIKTALPTNVIVILIFLLPSSYSFLNYCRKNRTLPDKEITGLLTWKYIHENMPWSLMFVVGGGFAIGKANKSTKLVNKVAAGLLGIRATTKPIPLLIFEIITLSMFLTAFGSNVAIVDQLMSFLAEVCATARSHPLILFFPCVLGCSMAFHLPVSTPPNAIACGYGNIKTQDIIFAGIGPTISAIILLEVFCLYWVDIVYSKVALDEFPIWAHDFKKNI